MSIECFKENNKMNTTASKPKVYCKNFQRYLYKQLKHSQINEFIFSTSKLLGNLLK